MRPQILTMTTSMSLVLIASCGGDASTVQPDASPSPPDAASLPDAGVLSDFEHGVDGFALSHAFEEGYWYSRYNLGALAMKSGLGETFMPDMTMVQSMVTMASDDLSTAVAPASAALLTRVYGGGDPSYLTASDSDPMNFGDERWAGTTPAPTTGAAFGWLTIKEIEWAKQFHVDSHFGRVGANDIPGAEERFAGLVLYAEAVMQAMHLDSAPADYSFARPEDGYAALLALSDLALITAPDVLPHSTGNRYKASAAMMAEGMGMGGTDMAAMFATMADMRYGTLVTPVTLHDHALAIEALAFYGAASATSRAAVKLQIAEYADALATAAPDGTLARAAILVGLSSARRAVGARPTWDAAATSAFDGLVASYDGRQAIFTDVATYSVEDVAMLLRALNGAWLYVPGVDFDTAVHILRDFFENAVNVSGLQIAAPPISEVAAYEQLPELFHRYPTTPTPATAGGVHGIAPVVAASVTYQPASETWTADRARFDTAGAMHLSNEMLWLHANEVDGFPQIP